MLGQSCRADTASKCSGAGRATLARERAKAHCFLYISTSGFRMYQKQRDELIRFRTVIVSVLHPSSLPDWLNWRSGSTKSYSSFSSSSSAASRSFPYCETRNQAPVAGRL